MVVGGATAEAGDPCIYVTTSEATECVYHTPNGGEFALMVDNQEVLKVEINYGIMRVVLMFIFIIHIFYHVYQI